MKSNRGALELSINAIVILVIAIVILGLAIVFIRKQFQQMGDFGTVGDKVKAQLMDDLTRSDKRVSISSRNVNIEQQKTSQEGFGITNKNNKPTYFVARFSNVEAVAATSVIDSAITVVTPNKGYLSYDTTVQKVGLGDSIVSPFKIFADTNTGDVMLKLTVYEYKTTGTAAPATLTGRVAPTPACTATLLTSCWVEYGSDSFFVSVGAS